MTTFTQVVNEGILYVEGLEVAYASATTVTVASGQARSSTNELDINLDTGVTIDFTVNGLNGLDTGSVAASKCYSIFLIANPTIPGSAGCIASLSLTSP